MIIEALSALLSEVRSKPEPRLARSRVIPQLKFPGPVRLYGWQPVLCRSRPIVPEPPEDPLTLKFSEKFRNSRWKVNESLQQIRSYSSSRIQWESKQGASVLDMTIAALQRFPRSSLRCDLTESGGIRFSTSELILDVSPGRETTMFTVYESSGSGASKEVTEKLINAAVESIARDVSNNVRSYSYSSSWSSGDEQQRLFDPHNPFGEMESMLNHFFGHSGHQDWSQPQPPAVERYQPSRIESSSGDRIVQELESMGVQVIIPEEEKGVGSDRVDWSSLAGYEKVKSQIEESVIIGLKHSGLFDKILARTRGKPVTKKSLPKVVLFEGPPGTGKSSTARIIAHETNVPMIHIPLESVVSKWFGESEKQMARIYELARQLAKSRNAPSVILFIDEIDSLVSSRDMGSPHEASRRILSVMLRQIDGFSTTEKTDVQSTLICATNRKKDLDKAFLSRVDASIHFGLPSEDSRTKILKLYANHLSDTELQQIASITGGLSGRNLKDLCQAAERHWAANVIRGLASDARDQDVEVSPPPVEVYIDAAKEKFNQQIA